MVDCRNCVFCKEIWKDDAYNCLQNLRLPFFNIVEVNECTKYLSALKWIPVSERLPEKGAKVLTFGVYGFSVNYRDRFSGKWRGVNGKPQWITHWMPLPNPPEEV